MNAKIETQLTKNLEAIASILIRCFVISISILVIWFLWSLTALDFGYQWYSQWFGLTKQEFVLVNLYSMSDLKLSGFIFFLVPYLAIKLFLIKLYKSSDFQ